MLGHDDIALIDEALNQMRRDVEMLFPTVICQTCGEETRPEFCVHCEPDGPRGIRQRFKCWLSDRRFRKNMLRREYPI